MNSPKIDFSDWAEAEWQVSRTTESVRCGNPLIPQGVAPAAPRKPEELKGLLGHQKKNIIDPEALQQQLISNKLTKELIDGIIKKAIDSVSPGDSNPVQLVKRITPQQIQAQECAEIVLSTIKGKTWPTPTIAPSPSSPDLPVI